MFCGKEFPMTILLSIGGKIQSIREKKGITQDQLGDKTGINAKYISAIERGQKNLTVLTLEKIAKGLDVDLFELLILPTGLEPEQRVKKAIDSLIKHADLKALNLCLGFLRKASS
jgi:transcriptional regulator with XRE-family HTH domain